MSEPTLLGPGEGSLIDVAGDRYRLLAARENTDGSYALIEAIVPPGGGPPPHFHRLEEEGFYVLEGEITFTINDQRHIAGPGTFANMPKGVPHAFRNETDRPARMLILVAPGGLERMFQEMGLAVDDPSTPIAPLNETAIGRILATAPRYGVEILPPPGH